MAWKSRKTLTTDRHSEDKGLPTGGRRMAWKSRKTLTTDYRRIFISPRYQTRNILHQLMYCNLDFPRYANINCIMVFQLILRHKGGSWFRLHFKWDRVYFAIILKCFQRCTNVCCPNPIPWSPAGSPHCRNCLLQVVPLLRVGTCSLMRRWTHNPPLPVGIVVDPH